MGPVYFQVFKINQKFLNDRIHDISKQLEILDWQHELFNQSFKISQIKLLDKNRI